MQLMNLSIEHTSKLISFIMGVLIDQVDDLVDAKEELTSVQMYTKYILQFVLICLTVYIIYFNKELSLLTTYIFVLGGIVGFLFAPNIVDATIWKILIAIAIPKFLYTFAFYLYNNKRS